ncbi:MAG: bifunctional ornithine acetyltransferase/N-acetylglutamate synthase, partial [Thermodesulfobacteriota bacterium]|nr:bifunctional ornithine acetyltransferase/N-acetylglutamate synthase [Thermodesulfobacteriota bacterium]
EDGEGATKFVEIEVYGARNKREAHIGAKAIANSSLVKTALFGEDANWGRIMSALGSSNILLDQNAIDLYIGGIQLVKGGALIDGSAESKVKEELQKRHITLKINLNLGIANEKIYTCDLSPEYVKINASYRT